MCACVSVCVVYVCVNTFYSHGSVAHLQATFICSLSTSLCKEKVKAKPTAINYFIIMAEH